MLETWILPLAMLLAFALILLVPMIEALFPSVRRTELPCPVFEREASVRLVSRPAFGIIEPVEVRSCSLFDDPEEITCARGCLKLSEAKG